MERLAHELEDEGIALPDDDRLLALLLAELDYARHPHAHEGTPPRYGAFVAATELTLPDSLEPFAVIDTGEAPLEVVRRLADGRSSFVARGIDVPDRLVSFDRTREYESSAVHLAQTTGGLVLQRLAQGWVRMAAPNGVSTWDGMHWSTKPLPAALAVRIHQLIPQADLHVLGRLLEFCVHWLGAGRVGASLIWRLDADPQDLGHLGFGAAVTIPQLDLARHEHFSPLLNALSQFDRAALVAPDGSIRTICVQMRSSDEARAKVATYRGTRHTAALRFSADERDALVFVVSSNGPLTVCWQGERLDIQ